MKPLLFGLFLVFAGCGGSGDAAGTAECVDHGHCPRGEACVDGSCVPVECFASDTCPYGEHCDDRSMTCEPGCAEDADCHAGESCDTAASECVSDACTDTHTDCGYGEVCNEETGECEVYDEYFCTECTPGDTSTCPKDHACEWMDIGQTYYCLPPCDTTAKEDECPYPARCLGPTGDAGFCSTNCSEINEAGEG